MRIRATVATAAEAARAHDAEHSRSQERQYFTQRFAERKRELEKLEKRVFPPQGKEFEKGFVGTYYKKTHLRIRAMLTTAAEAEL